MLCLREINVSVFDFFYYTVQVESVQKASIDFNARIRALGVLVSELERAAVAANTKVDLLSPIDPVSYHELGCVGQNDGCCTEESPCDVGQVEKRYTFPVQ